MKWIDAKIELPPDNENVIVHCPGASEEIWLGYFWHEDNKWTDAAFGEVIDVTHWMAMPSVPELLRGKPVTAPGR